MRVCSQAGCPTLYPTTEGSKCRAHRAAAERSRRPNGNPYSTPGHRAFRATVLARDHICVLCHQAFATIADHYPITRRDLTEAGMNPNDPAYGRGLCKPCHDRHTAATSPGGWADRS